ncbi:MAG: hypothetical protein K5651_09850 [Bacteroidales bacterium]|nr:hypothetical protein [Bacteroidales bacterium]
MKVSNKTLKKALLCIVIVVAFFAVCDLILIRIATGQLRKALADIPGAQIDFKKVNLALLAGNLAVEGVEITLIDSTLSEPLVEGRIEVIKLEGMSLLRLLKGEAHARRLLIRGPEAKLILPPKQAAKARKGKTSKASQNDTTQASPDSSFLNKVSLSELRLEKGKIDLSQLKGSMKLHTQNIECSVRDLGFVLAEKRVEYSDSCYRLSLDSLDFTDEMGLTRYQIGHLATANAGPLEALNLHLYNCVAKEVVAERMGKVAAVWFDAKLDSLQTSALNIPRMAKEQRINIASIRISGPDIVLMQDDRYPPAVPYPTFQEGLNSVKIPISIQQIDARVDKFTFIWETTHVNRGTFPLHKLRVAIRSASNASGNTMKMNIRSGQKSGGRMKLALSVRNDKSETTQGKLEIYDLDAGRLDPFIRPLFGATVQADIHQIDATFKGDKSKMTGNFLMLYDGLNLKAWNDKTAPYQFIAQNSGFVTFLANLIVPKSNPVADGQEPKCVEVTFKRDPMLPYPAYIIQSLTNGMLKTVLPGGAVHKTQK